MREKSTGSPSTSSGPRETDGPWPSASISSSDLLDLRVFQLDRRGAAEDGDGDLEAGAAFVDLFHRAVEGGEGAVGHAHLLADLELDRGLGPLDAIGDLAL